MTSPSTNSFNGRQASTSHRFLLENFDPSKFLEDYSHRSDLPVPKTDGRQLLHTSETGYQIFVIREKGRTIGYSVVGPDGKEQDGMIMTRGVIPAKGGGAMFAAGYDMITHVCWEDSVRQCSHCIEVRDQ
jgi:hypothetical protein